MPRDPYVAEYSSRLQCSKDQATGEKGDDEKDAVHELRARASHIQFIEEPVNVNKGRRKLPQHEVAAVEVDKRTLWRYVS